MKIYSFLYYIDDIECRININALNLIRAWETVKIIIPNATKIILLS